MALLQHFRADVPTVIPAQAGIRCGLCAGSATPAGSNLACRREAAFSVTAPMDSRLRGNDEWERGALPFPHTAIVPADLIRGSMGRGYNRRRAEWPHGLPGQARQ